MVCGNSENTRPTVSDGPCVSYQSITSATRTSVAVGVPVGLPTVAVAVGADATLVDVDVDVAAVGRLEAGYGRSGQGRREADDGQNSNK